MGIQRLSLQDFPPGEVLIQVGYAAMNYKDALVCTATGKVAQTYPLVPGLEFAGEVVESRDQRFMSGDEVLASDFGSTLGISRYGGYSEYARIPGEMLFPLARELDCKQALVLSAGMTVALALHHLEKNGLTPRSGPVLVTGATGGVGSLAVSLLSQRWAGSIDTVGGTTLAYLMRTTKKGGAIAAIGVAGGATFHATVFPLVLRGIKVLGIDMPSMPLQTRRELWEEVIGERALLSSVDSIVSEVTLEDIPRVTRAMLGGHTRGRILVRPSEQ